MGLILSHTGRLLRRLLELVGGAGDYFVSGSLSFLPLLKPYRQPKHDVDVAIARHLFERSRRSLRPQERVRVLGLSEVAVASESALARAVSPRTSFVHVYGPDGLLDLACFTRAQGRYAFSLGAGMTLTLPSAIIEERIRTLEWEGIRFRAGPPELALIPKAVWYLAARAGTSQTRYPDADTIKDLHHLRAIVDWEFVELLLAEGGVRWLGRRLPRLLRKLDPFATGGMLEIRDAPLVDLRSSV